MLTPAYASNRTTHPQDIPISLETKIRELILSKHLSYEVCNSKHIEDFLKLRWCFVHAMLETNLVPNTCHIFEAKKSTGDYHDMFNARNEQEWWHENQRTNLPPKCVIVMDRASYSLVPSVQIMPGTMRKHELQQWLISLGKQIG